MGRHKRSIAPRHGLALGLALALAGCSTSAVQLSTGGPQPSVVAPGGSTLGALITIGVLSAFAYESQNNGIAPLAPPPLDPERRVLEQDCSKPIADWSANLRCR